MTNNVLAAINNFFILLGIAIILYGIACLWAVSADDFNYYFTKLGEILRRLADKIKNLLGIVAPKSKSAKKENR